MSRDPSLIKRAGSESDLEAPHRRETGHIISPVYHIPGIGYVFKSCEYRHISADIPCDFEVKQGIILMLYSFRHIQSANALEVGSDDEEFPRLPFHAEEILIFWCTGEIFQRGMQIAVCRCEP